MCIFEYSLLRYHNRHRLQCHTFFAHIFNNYVIKLGNLKYLSITSPICQQLFSKLP